MSEQDKYYTIFDNFDKLDLSPAASNIEPGSFDLLDTTSSKINTITYGSFNETIYKDDNLVNHPRPYSFSSDMMGYLPNMFNFINNNRFYINLNGQVLHTSKLSVINPNSSKNYPFIEYSLLVNNIFKQQFFFDIYLGNLERHLSNAFMLYKNDFETPVINSYIEVGADGDGEVLKPLFDMNNLWNDNDYGNTIFLNGNNRIIFDYVTDTKVLKTIDLFTPAVQAPGITQIDYLDDWAKPGGYVEAVDLLLQRLLYPYKTQQDKKTKHFYLVADLKKSNSSKPVLTISKYNFYTENAESFPENVQLEWQLPNIYAYYKFSTTGNDPDSNQYFTKIVKLESDTPSQDNFTFSEYYNISNKSLPTTKNIERHKRIIFGSKVDTLLENIVNLEEITKQLIPYYNKITLPVEYTQMGIVDILEKIKLLDTFMSIIGNYFSSGGLIDTALDFSNSPNSKSLHTFSLVNSSEKSGEKTKASVSTLQILDLSTIKEDDFGHYAFDFENRNIKLAPLDQPNVIENILDEIDYFLGSIKSIKNYLTNNAAASRQLTISSINNGEKCYSEIVAFEIAKYKIINGEKTHLQSFFVPCLNDKEKTLIDTQVFYGQEYIYEVFSISYVVGTEYTSPLEEYPFLAIDVIRKDADLISTQRSTTPSNSHSSDSQEENIDGFKLDFYMPENVTESNTIPKAMLIRAPYYNNLSISNSAENPNEQEKTTVLDNPPLPPDISFQPYKDVNNKVLITLNINYGEERLKAIRVFPEDEERIINIQENQKHLKLKPSEILYRTDDFIGKYKIYKTDRQPISWESFFNSDLKEIENEQTAGYNDDILPNVDYYYFARFEDMHGNLSNPTDIFYLRMVQDGDFPPFMILKTYKFSDAKPPFIYEKNMKKFLKIRLADDTRDFYNVDTLKDIDFGYKKARLSQTYNQLKKYKVRITSKKTGKKLDINIDFKKKLSNQYLNPDLLVGGEDQSTLTLSKEEGFKQNKLVEQQIKKDISEAQNPKTNLDTTVENNIGPLYPQYE